MFYKGMERALGGETGIRNRMHATENGTMRKVRSKKFPKHRTCAVSIEAFTYELFIVERNLAPMFLACT